jgi:hypothetical protein
MIPRAMLAVAYATGRASHARQVKGDDPDKKGYPGPPGWGCGVGLTTPHSKKLIVTKVEKRKKLDGFNDDGESWWQIGKNGRILFDRPKPTVGCSASGRRRIDEGLFWYFVKCLDFSVRFILFCSGTRAVSGRFC